MSAYYILRLENRGSEMKLVYSCLLLVLQLGCKARDTDNHVLDAGLSLPFVKIPSESVLKSGFVGSPVFIADPGVVKDSSGYHLFITNQFCDLNNNAKWDENEHLFDADATLLCVAQRQVGATMYAFSGDEGKTWSVRPVPVIANGPAGWDDYNVETPFPFVHNDTLYVFYSAYGHKNGSLFRARYQISYASLALNGRTLKKALLEDGDVLAKYSDGATPFYPGNITTAGYDNNVQEPSVAVTDSGFELFFTGLKLKDPGSDLSPGNGNKIDGLALARQKFDFQWNKIGGMEVAKTTEQLDPTSDEFAVAPINIGEVHYVGNRYHIFYTSLELGADFHKGERIAHAISEDGLSWTNMQVVLEPGSENSFDGWGIMAPSIVFEEDRAVLFYSAWGDKSDSKCVMRGEGAKWGKTVAGETKCVHGNLGRAVVDLQMH